MNIGVVGSAYSEREMQKSVMMDLRRKKRVEFDEGMPIANIEPCIFLRIEFAEKELAMQIEYIHELQHAMRLFEIEKEIKL